MNGPDFYKIQAFAKSGGYNVTQSSSEPPVASIFELPDVSYGDLKNVLWRGIDWDRFLNDFVNNLLGKLGSFADDWYFFLGPAEYEVVTSQPGISEEDIKQNELVRVQEIVLRKLKLCGSRRFLFPVQDWKGFCKQAEKGAWSYIDYEAIDGKEAEEARKREGIQDKRHLYAKLSYVRYCELGWEIEYPNVDDVIALHRNGKYTFPGERINFANLRYKEET